MNIYIKKTNKILLSIKLEKKKKFFYLKKKWLTKIYKVYNSLVRVLLYTHFD